MCATVCPSQALFFGTREQIEQMRPMSTPVNRFQFGSQVISTRVFMMAPRALTSKQTWVDVTAAMDERPRERSVVLRMVATTTTAESGGSRAAADGDPFAEVTI